jgi:hypothetical protein
MFFDPQSSLWLYSGQEYGGCYDWVWISFVPSWAGSVRRRIDGSKDFSNSFRSTHHAARITNKLALFFQIASETHSLFLTAEAAKTAEKERNYMSLLYNHLRPLSLFYLANSAFSAVKMCNFWLPMAWIFALCYDLFPLFDTCPACFFNWRDILVAELRNAIYGTCQACLMTDTIFNCHIYYTSRNIGPKGNSGKISETYHHLVLRAEYCVLRIEFSVSCVMYCGLRWNRKRGWFLGQEKRFSSRIKSEPF